MHLDDLFESFTSDGDFVPAVMAEKIIAHLEEHDPDRLAEYLHERRTALVTDDLRHWLQSRRRRARLSAKPRQFKEEADRFDSGGSADEFVSVFATTFRVDDSNTQRTVADMTGEDHRFVASTYAASGRRDLMLSAFHNAVAKKVGKRRTADVLSEDQYLELLGSIEAPAA